MDAVENFLFCVVGFSVLAFLIIGQLEERRKTCPCRDIYDHEEEGRSVGAGTGKQIISGDFKSAETVEEEEEGKEKREDRASCEKSGFFACAVSDDWEGIERTELEKIFGEAVVFVSRKCIDDDYRHQLREDMKLELYGLSKVVLQGPCYGSRPMALKVSARSKWNAWQKLGNMSREMAMEKYIDILSKTIPSWKGENEATSNI